MAGKRLPLHPKRCQALFVSQCIALEQSWAMSMLSPCSHAGRAAMKPGSSGLEAMARSRPKERRSQRLPALGVMQERCQTLFVSQCIVLEQSWAMSMLSPGGRAGRAAMRPSSSGLEALARSLGQRSAEPRDFLPSASRRSAARPRLSLRGNDFSN